MSFLVVIVVKEQDGWTYWICLLAFPQVKLLGRVVDPLESYWWSVLFKVQHKRRVETKALELLPEICSWTVQTGIIYWCSYLLVVANVNLVIGDRQLVKLPFCIDTIIIKVTDSDLYIAFMFAIGQKRYYCSNLKLYVVSMLWLYYYRLLLLRSCSFQYLALILLVLCEYFRDNGMHVIVYDDLSKQCCISSNVHYYYVVLGSWSFSRDVFYTFTSFRKSS